MPSSRSARKAAAKVSINGDLARAVYSLLKPREAAMLQDLRQLVELESPSSNKKAVDALGAQLRNHFQRLGATVTTHTDKVFGDHLQAHFPGTNSRRADDVRPDRGKPEHSTPAKPVLLLGHFDTVWDIGTLKTMPFKLEKGRVWGPGVYDMKVGIVMMMHAIAALREANGGELPRPVIVWLVTDEEVGSDSSRPNTEKLARECEAVFVMEPSQTLDGSLKTWRKGVGEYNVKVTGVAAHSGVDFEKGHSAIVELARQIQKISGFVEMKRGLTVNPGVIRGGTRYNVVAAEAEVDVDVRIMQLKDAALVEKKFRSLRPFNKKCQLTITGGVNRPPMERTEKVLGLYRTAEAVARELGFKLTEKGTGGGSDGNFTAALGIPTLDGMGGVGEGAHAAHESVLIEHIVPRTALLAGMIASV